MKFFLVVRIEMRRTKVTISYRNFFSVTLCIYKEIKAIAIVYSIIIKHKQNKLNKYFRIRLFIRMLDSLGCNNLIV